MSKFSLGSICLTLRQSVGLASLASVLACTSTAFGVISYATPGSLYTQNFDTKAVPDAEGTGLPNNKHGQSPNQALGYNGEEVYGWRNDYASSTDGNWSIVGWHLLHPLTPPAGANGLETGFNQNQRLRFGTGSQNTGAFWSFGSTSAGTERALGIVNSNSLTNASSANHPWSYLGAVFRNDTDSTLTEFTLSYYGEQWRDSGNAAQHSLVFDYGINAPNIQDAIGGNPTLGTYVPVPELNFTGPFANKNGDGTSTNLLGTDAAGGRVAIGPVTVTGLNWQPGDTLWIRWKDANDPGDDHGLAIDDLVFSASIGGEPGLQGDYNGDGTVNAADYVLWRKSPGDFGGDPAGYTTWFQNFGATAAGSGSGAVPEPSSIVCVLFAFAGMVASRRYSR